MSDFILDNDEKLIKSGTASFIKSKLNVKQRTVFFTTDRLVITRFQLDKWFPLSLIISFFYFFMNGKQIDHSIKISDIKEILIEKHGLTQKITVLNGDDSVSILPSGAKDWFNLIVKAIKDVYPVSELEQINENRFIIKKLGEEKNIEHDYLIASEDAQDSINRLNMSDKKVKYGVGALAVLLVAGFSLGSRNSVPRCSDTRTTDLVSQIANREMAKQLGAEAAKLYSYAVDAIRTTSENKQTGAFECAAQLDININSTGQSNQIPITYSVEKTDDGSEFYVNVFGL